MDNQNINKNSWSKDADHRLKNRKWLRYSSNIARRILAAIEDKEDFSQANLARLLGVSPQHISKIVKGKENLTLETIASFSTVLGTELISFPEYKYSTSFNQIASQTATTHTQVVGDVYQAAMVCAVNYFQDLKTAEIFVNELPVSNHPSQSVPYPLKAA